MRWLNLVAQVREYWNAYKLWVENDAGKRLLGIPRNRCDDNIKTHLNKWDGYLELDSSGSR
jgi:hypothetical protein